MTKLLSLGVMCGDEHAGEPLRRCLSSALEMKRGCPFDEIVIGWNGKDEKKFWGTIRDLGYQAPDLDMTGPTYTLTSNHLPELKVLKFDWPGRFDVARNAYWPKLTGEWLFSMDADDTLADAETPEGLKAIEAVERDYNMPPPTPGVKALTLREWLGTLPEQLNTIFMAYDYIIDDNGYVVNRQKAKRLVRRRVGHIWCSPEESGIHEQLIPMGGVPEHAIDNLGILLRHAPSQSAVDRALRNKDIITKMTTSPLPVDARHAYDLTAAAVADGNLEMADKSIRIAIERADDDLNRYVYRMTRASLQFTRNLPEAAMGEAFAAIGLLPEMQPAYFIAATALYSMGKWAGCIEWAERGMSRQPLLLSLDNPMDTFVQPRAQVAASCLNLGLYEKALKFAQECHDRYPKDTRVIEVYQKVVEESAKEKLRNNLLDAAETLCDYAPWFARMLLEMVPNYTATRSLALGMRYRVLMQRALNTTTANTNLVSLPRDGEYKDAGGLVDLEQALTEAKDRLIQLTDYEQVTPRQAKMKSRVAEGTTIAFYSPAAVELWAPRSLEHKGLGGSESSLAYLAREVSKRGHIVEVYTPMPDGASLSLWSGNHHGEKFAVVEKDFTRVREAQDAHVIVTCRAPYLARENKDAVWRDKRIFCWHQDNGYGNPWMWGPEVIEMQEHLHVSEWAMKGLLKEGYGQDVEDVAPTAPSPHRHHLLGNGVPLECGEDWEKFPRNPHRVIYASDPTRGLEQLLAMWPQVHERVPDAELWILSGFRVMFAIKQSSPGLSVFERAENIRKTAESMAPLGVKMLGWLPHASVIAAMKASNVYCYPGGPMPEGFGVSMAQAAACGCDVIYPDAGALPEVLGESQHPCEVIDAEVLVRRLQVPRAEEGRRRSSQLILSEHSWPVVADRFLKIIHHQ